HHLAHVVELLLAARTERRLVEVEVRPDERLDLVTRRRRRRRRRRGRRQGLLLTDVVAEEPPGQAADDRAAGRGAGDLAVARVAVALRDAEPGADATHGGAPGRQTPLAGLVLPHLGAPAERQDAHQHHDTTLAHQTPLQGSRVDVHLPDRRGHFKLAANLAGRGIPGLPVLDRATMRARWAAAPTDWAASAPRWTRRGPARYGSRHGNLSARRARGGVPHLLARRRRRRGLERVVRPLHGGRALRR